MKEENPNIELEGKSAGFTLHAPLPSTSLLSPVKDMLVIGADICEQCGTIYCIGTRIIRVMQQHPPGPLDFRGGGTRP